jgi:rod shape-determining protein MreC
VAFAPNPSSSRRDTLAFVICLVVSIAARLAPPPAQQAVATAVTETALSPFLFLQQQSELIKASRGRYARVASLRDSVLLRALDATALEEENERLRDLLGLSARLRIGHVSAEVLHQASAASGLLAMVSAGRDDGVEPKDPVVASDGLVGVIQDAGATTATMLLWTHPDFRVSAMTRDGSVFGIAAPRGSAGPNTMLMELRGVAYGDLVDPGTVVYTSGLGGTGGVYPRGVPIGTVMAVSEEREGWSRTYVVRPAVHPASLTHVVVLTGTAPDVGGAFNVQ